METEKVATEFKFELVQVLPPVEGWVVLYPSYNKDDSGIESWEPVYAMAHVKQHWAKGGEVVHSGSMVVPLVRDIFGVLAIAGVDDLDSFDTYIGSATYPSSQYTLLHWSKVKDFIKDLQNNSRRLYFSIPEGLLEYVETFEAPANQANALKVIATALKELGFGSTTSPGAIEGHTMEMMKAYSELASAVGGGLSEIASAIEGGT